MWIKLKEYAVQMLDEFKIVYAEKGFEPFKKPLLYATPAFLIAYFIIYSPSVKKMESRQREYTELCAISEFYGRYHDAKIKIKNHRSVLPALKDKDEWLNYLLTKTAKEHGIVLDSVSEQKEVDMTEAIMVSREVSFKSDYHTVGKVVSDIENSEIFVKITAFELKKNENNLGKVSVTLTLSTLFAKYV